MLRRFIRLILFFCALWVTQPGIIVASDAWPKTKEDEKKERGREKESLKRYEENLRSEALGIFREGEDLEAADDLHRAYLTYRDAEAKYRTKEITGAKKRVQEAIHRQTANLVSTAQSLDKQSQWDAAISALRQAQKYDPDSALLSYDLSVAFAPRLPVRITRLLLKDFRC